MAALWSSFAIREKELDDRNGSFKDDRANKRLLTDSIAFVRLSD